MSRPTYNEGSGGGGVRRPIITKNSQKFDEGEEEQNLKDYCPDDGTDDGFTSLATEDDFNVPVVLRESEFIVENYSHSAFINCKRFSPPQRKF